MRYLDIDMNLTDEHRALRQTMIKFGREVVRPAGVALDAMSPEAAIADGSVLYDVFREYRKLGLHKTGLPSAIGGLAEETDLMTHLIIGEELGYADSGLAISLGVSGMPFGFAALMPSPALQQMARDYAADDSGKMIGCWAITEPDHGTDWYLGKDKPECGPQVKAVKDGDHFVVNGEKSMWVSNGTIATHAALHVGFDASMGMDGSGIMILPLDLPGISKTKPLDKLGQRALNQGSIVFEDARVPAEYVLTSPQTVTFSQMAEQMLARVNGGMSVVFMGLARAAFDMAFSYAQERIQGGVPIFEHQNVKGKLFRMFMAVESCRAHALRCMAFNADAAKGGGMPSGCHAVSAKVLSTETAFRVASDALQLHGGNGLSKEYEIEKLFRDARTSMIEDGVNESLGLVAIDFLADRTFGDRLK